MLTLTDHNGYTPLTLATKLSYCDYQGMLPILTYLLTSFDATIYQDEYGLNAIDYAVFYYHPKLIELLFNIESEKYFNGLDQTLNKMH